MLLELSGATIFVKLVMLWLLSKYWHCNMSVVATKDFPWIHGHNTEYNFHYVAYGKIQIL